MKKTLLIFSIFAFGFSLFTSSQIINTDAGNGTGGYSGDGGQATAAELRTPIDAVADNAGNLYISDYGNQRVRMVNTLGVISTFAGNGTSGFSGDGGPATAAELHNPFGIRIANNGNIYVADELNYCIRMINTNGIISTVAGIGSAGYSGDGGPATAAELSTSWQVALDASGNLYISDLGNERVRMVNTSGIISTFAGNGNFGNAGDGGPATAAELGGLSGVAADAQGNVYLACQNSYKVRMVNTSGIISTFAGNGTSGSAGDGGPATAAELSNVFGVVVDNAGNLYLGDQGNEKIRFVNTSGIISTFAGDGFGGYFGDGGQATAAELSSPNASAVAPAGNVYIIDQQNNRIRVVSGVITAVNNISNKDEVRIYPNPNNGTFNLSIKNLQSGINSKVEIYNALGEKVYSDIIPQTTGNTSMQIDLHTRSAGIYFYRVSSETGVVAEGKFVIE